MKQLSTMPAGFIDRHPLRGPFFDAAESRPTRALDAGLLFADGRTGDGAWVPAGRLWWGWCDVEKRFCELTPIGWRPLDPTYSVCPA